MSTRRGFLRAFTGIAAAALAGDDLLALLEPRRRLWPGWSAPTKGGFLVPADRVEDLQRILKEIYLPIARKHISMPMVGMIPTMHMAEGEHLYHVKLERTRA